MKKLLLLLLLAASVLSPAASAQTTTTLTGTVRDLSNAAVTSGQVSFTLQPGIDTAMSGTARFTPSEIDCTITGAGAVKALDGVSTCTVVNNTAISQPSGTSYKVCIQPQFIQPGSCFVWYATGGSVDITQQVPTPPLTPAYNLVDTFSNQTIGGNKTFSGNITFGGTLSLGAITLGGNLNMGGNSITNAAAGTFSGNVSVGGTFVVTGSSTAGSYTTPNANPATAGLLRAASTDSAVCFRNNALSSNVCIKKTGTLASPFPADTLDLTDFGGAKASQLFATSAGGQSASGFLATSATTAAIGFNSTGGAADQKWADCFLNTTSFNCRFVNDANNAANAFFSVTRGGGAAVGAMTLGAGGGVQTVPTGTGTLAFGNLGSQYFTSSGTHTISATTEKVTICAGGGAGGGATAANNGGGGGAGGCAVKVLTGLTIGNTITVTIGPGGTGVSAAAGNAGTNSTISSGTQTITTVTTNAGGGGNANGSQSSGGFGGAISTNGTGNWGGNTGNDGFGITGGAGAGSMFGGGGPNSNGGSPGNAALSCGGGGGGAGAGANRTGGNGSAGCALFEWVN